MTPTNKPQPNKEEAQRLIGLNPDARQYFFTKADGKWFEWLRDNGFLDAIRQKAEDPSTYQYRMPELEYLVRVAPDKPTEVTDLMLSVDVPNNFRPEVVDRFLWICAHLPSEQLAQMVAKIRDEQWVQRMGGFSHWGFNYEKMFDILAEAKDHASIVVLAEAILAVRTVEELGKGTRSKDQPFYFDDLSQTGVFGHLNNVDDVHAEAAFGLATSALGKVVFLGGEKEDEVFSMGEIFSLFDVDFFTLQGGRKKGYSSREEVKDLAATAKKLAVRLIGGKCETETPRRLHDAHIATLPDARTTWRFRLYIWSLCPKVFKKELRDGFFRLFGPGKRIWPIAGGAEYERALQKAFITLDDTDQREYVRQLFELFVPRDDSSYGYDLFSSIYPALTTNEREAAEKLFDKALNPEHVPSPTLGQISSGTITPRVPPGSDAEWGRPIPEVVELLKTTWSPAALRELRMPGDFLRPINAEGIASRLQGEIKKRLPEYLGAANLFFDRDKLDPHYTYSFLRALSDALKTPPDVGLNWGALGEMLKSFTASAKQEPFQAEGKRDDADTWLSNWTGVHSALADLIKDLLDADTIPFKQSRQDLLGALEYLLAHPNPTSEVHEPPQEGATGRQGYADSDPYTHAINSVRGRAFQALVVLVYRDGKEVEKGAAARVESDVKHLYESVLEKENTEAVMFLFGHYIPTFYYQDTDWLRPLLPKIFPDAPDKKDLRLAALEGYLTTNLYPELFVEFEPQYKYLISLTPEQYTQRRYFGDIDEALASHVGLAYMHFDSMNIDSELFKRFWYSEVPERRQELVSFVGRQALSRDDAKKWCEENKVKVERLPVLWDWVLAKCNEPEVFARFGFWMSAKKEMFDPVWLAERVRRTLEKSKGVLDWEYGMMESLPVFVKVAPRDTLEMLKSYIEATLAGEQSRRGWLHIDKELVSILKELANSSDADIKRDTHDFINSVVLRGGAPYWPLKAALELL